MHYKVFEIDACFESYATYTVLVGGENIQDILNNFDKIFPPIKETVTREDWMEDEYWNVITEYGKYKEGDIIYEPMFTEEQKEEFKLSLTDDPYKQRIKEIEHMYSDTPYTILATFAYYE